jgi:competence protein ComEC
MDFLKSKSKIFLSTLISFIIGVAIYLWWKPDFKFFETSVVLVISSILLIIIAVFWRKDILIRYLALGLSFLFLGFVFSQAYFYFLLANPLISEKQEANFEGFVCDDPEIGMQDVKYQICLLSLNEEEVNFKILLTTDLYPEYKFGEIILGKGSLERPGIIDGFDYQNYLLAKKIFAVIYKPKINNSKHLAVNSHDIGGLNYLILRLEGVLYKIKNEFETTINQIMPEPEASFLNGLILGEKSGMGKELIDNFNKTGTTHIIALSGFNVTIIIFAVATLFGYLGKRKAFFISLAFVIFFVVMTGASSSVVRAAIMVMLVLAAPLLGRHAKSINILVLTAFVMILFNPLILRYDLGFALSFLSISGLILLSPLIIKKFEKGKLAKTPAAVKSPLIETISAQVFAFPLILYSFSRVSIIAPLTNVLILPFIPLTMLLGFVAAILGMISRFLGEIFAYFPFFFLKYMIVVVKSCSKIPFASIEVNKFPVILTILIYILIIISVSFLNRKIIVKNGTTRIK